MEEFDILFHRWLASEVVEPLMDVLAVSPSRERIIAALHAAYLKGFSQGCLTANKILLGGSKNG